MEVVDTLLALWDQYTLSYAILLLNCFFFLGTEIKTDGIPAIMALDWPKQMYIDLE